MTVYYFAQCDVEGCDWIGPIVDSESDADVSLIEHETDKHPRVAEQASRKWQQALADIDRTWEQAQADIGDDMYERSRYDEQDIDVEPGREDRWTPPQPL